jgi:predicted dehydrogenase
MRFVLIGAGQRGMIYAKYAQKKGHQIAAVAETDPGRRALAAAEFGIPEEKCFDSGRALLSEPRMGDAAIIATMDRDHYAEAIPAMEKGYHLLLEKPISPDPGETLAIERAADRTGRHVTVCHVLRYSPFFREVKNETIQNDYCSRGSCYDSKCFRGREHAEFWCCDDCSDNSERSLQHQSKE